MSAITAGIRQSCKRTAVELPRRAKQELHYVINDNEDLLRVVEWAANAECDAYSLFASDERALEANSFKSYLLLSTPDGYLVILEHATANPALPVEFLSLRHAFPNVSRWEQEIVELFGIMPGGPGLQTTEREILVGPYPPGLNPLRRTASMDELRAEMDRVAARDIQRSPALPEGVHLISAGPIHAGIKEAGPLRLQGAGETIEALHFEAGRKHRGIEKLFEAQTFDCGWQLAEKITGDASFAHSLAYCQMVESIAGITPPPLAQAWRAALLELERIASHILNVAFVANDIGLGLCASPLLGQHELMRQLNAAVSGSRLIRGVNRPGGVAFAPELSGERLAARLTSIVTRFLELGISITEAPACRDRLIGVGVLTLAEARQTGALGPIRRASRDLRHDARLRHPFGVYERPEISALISETVAESDEARALSGDTPRMAGATIAEMTGDNFARLVLCLAEAETSARIIGQLAPELVPATRDCPALLEIGPSLAEAEPFEFGVGCVEGARGAITCCALKGAGQQPLRLKYTDPSTAALLALGVAAGYRPGSGRNRAPIGDIIADAPVTNASMNGSPAGSAG